MRIGIGELTKLPATNFNVQYRTLQSGHFSLSLRPMPVTVPPVPAVRTTMSRWPPTWDQCCHVTVANNFAILRAKGIRELQAGNFTRILLLSFLNYLFTVAVFFLWRTREVIWRHNLATLPGSVSPQPCCCSAPRGCRGCGTGPGWSSWAPGIRKQPEL